MSARSLALLTWAALAACGGSGPATGDASPSTPGSPSSDSPGRFERVICPGCVRAGGETSDFGDGREVVPLGAGIEPAPTPCELSTTVSPVELDAARALGFGQLLARLEGSFELPFEWRATEFDLDRPARGYTAATRVRGTLRALAAEHHVPSLEGCTDSLRVQVATTLETADGALSIAGTLRATLERGSAPPTLLGTLDLSDARGTLEVDPPPSENDVMGFVRALLYAWPDAMRLSLSIGMADVDDLGRDTAAYFYEPLEARAPLDDCRPSDRPLRFDEPTPTIGAASTPPQSLADRFPELLSLIEAPQPFSARWMSGDVTAFDVDVGTPSFVCDEVTALSGSVPYRLQSGDGRVDVDSEARMRLSFAPDGALGSGFFSIAEAAAAQPATGFAESTGISGIDFGPYAGAVWYTGLRFEAAASVMSGELEVRGVDVDGRATGSPGVYGAVLDSLGW